MQFPDIEWLSLSKLSSPETADNFRKYETKQHPKKIGASEEGAEEAITHTAISNDEALLFNVY